MVIEADCSSNLQSLLEPTHQNGSLSKMLPDYLVVKMGKISELLLERWTNSGMVWHGDYWMLNTSEHPSDVVESSLSQVIKTSAPLTYFLHKEHLLSLLNRAEAKKRELPQGLKQAIEAQITILSNMPELEEILQQDLKGQDIEMMEKLGHLTGEGVPTLYVRRMLPSEYEILQGFPEGWTDVDMEL